MLNNQIGQDKYLKLFYFKIQIAVLYNVQTVVFLNFLTYRKKIYIVKPFDYFVTS